MQEEIELWAVNQESFAVFEAMGTQWRMGMGGATGLDYGVIPVVMDVIGTDADRRREIFHDIRIMEREALQAMADGQDD